MRETLCDVVKQVMYHSRKDFRQYPDLFDKFQDMSDKIEVIE
jgi:hypothetical protein